MLLLQRCFLLYYKVVSSCDFNLRHAIVLYEVKFIVWKPCLYRIVDIEKIIQFPQMQSKTTTDNCQRILLRDFQEAL